LRKPLRFWMNGWTIRHGGFSKRLRSRVARWFGKDL
jgi:hypothetical protein